MRSSARHNDTATRWKAFLIVVAGGVVQAVCIAAKIAAIFLGIRVALSLAIVYFSGGLA